MNRIFSLITIFSFALSLFVQPAYAISTPEFPSCANPTGTVKASYDSGKHGIVGSSQEYFGKDIVYSLENGNFLQCFTPEDNKNGIQSNWLKASNLSEEEKNILKNEGWIYVANGALWGLEDCAYMVKHIEFVCPTDTSKPSATPTPTSVPTTTNNGSGGTGGPVQTVLTAATNSVNNFASTGNAQYIYGFAAIASGLLLAAYTFRKLSTRS